MEKSLKNKLVAYFANLKKKGYEQYPEQILDAMYPMAALLIPNDKLQQVPVWARTKDGKLVKSGANITIGQDFTINQAGKIDGVAYLFIGYTKNVKTPAGEKPATYVGYIWAGHKDNIWVKPSGKSSFIGDENEEPASQQAMDDLAQDANAVFAQDKPLVNAEKVVNKQIMKVEDMFKHITLPRVVGAIAGGIIGGQVAKASNIDSWVGGIVGLIGGVYIATLIEDKKKQAVVNAISNS